MPFKTILFDFDYTLADPLPGITDCVNFALAGLGVPAAPEEDIGRTIGLSLADTFLKLAGPAHSAHFEAFMRLFVERADVVMIDQTTLYDSVPAALQQLKKQGCRLGIVSMKYREHIEPVLQRENVREAFEVIIGGRDISQPKPDPEGLHLALDRLGGAPAAVVYVGDSLNDAETARRAGVPFIAVLSGAAPQKAFASYEVHQFLDHVTELPAWLGADRAGR